ncbi:hypothetical protein THAOC_23783, partial [Thalassiosira oceanica]
TLPTTRRRDSTAAGTTSPVPADSRSACGHTSATPGESSDDAVAFVARQRSSNLPSRRPRRGGRAVHELQRRHGGRSLRPGAGGPRPWMEMMFHVPPCACGEDRPTYVRKPSRSALPVRRAFLRRRRRGRRGEAGERFEPAPHL